MKMTFTEQIEQIKKERKNQVEARVQEMMSKLDYSKHDKRNDKKHVKHALDVYYNRRLDSTITAGQWDEMFSIYTPYSGTY
jgi:hypothetical protein